LGLVRVRFRVRFRVMLRLRVWVRLWVRVRVRVRDQDRAGRRREHEGGRALGVDVQRPRARRAASMVRGSLRGRPEAGAYIESKAAQPSVSWLSGGLSQRQSMPQAAPGSGHFGLVFDQKRVPPPTKVSLSERTTITVSDWPSSCGVNWPPLV
jgi:hypothetical protein